MEQAAEPDDSQSATIPGRAIPPPAPASPPGPEPGAEADTWKEAAPTLTQIAIVEAARRQRAEIDREVLAMTRPEPEPEPAPAPTLAEPEPEPYHEPELEPALSLPLEPEPCSIWPDTPPEVLPEIDTMPPFDPSRPSREEQIEPQEVAPITPAELIERAFDRRIDIILGSLNALIERSWDGERATVSYQDLLRELDALLNLPAEHYPLTPQYARCCVERYLYLWERTWSVHCADTVAIFRPRRG